MRVSNKVLGDYLKSSNVIDKFEAVLGGTMRLVNWDDATDGSWTAGAIEAWCNVSKEPWRTLSANWKEHLIELGV